MIETKKNDDIVSLGFDFIEAQEHSNYVRYIYKNNNLEIIEYFFEHSHVIDVKINDLLLTNLTVKEIDQLNKIVNK